MRINLLAAALLALFQDNFAFLLCPAGEYRVPNVFFVFHFQWTGPCHGHCLRLPTRAELLEQLPKKKNPSAKIEQTGLLIEAYVGQVDVKLARNIFPVAAIFYLAFQKGDNCCKDGAFTGQVALCPSHRLRVFGVAMTTRG